MSRLLTLESWAAAEYGDDAPCATTLRRWVKEGHISPRPEKHGRAFFVKPGAVYVPTAAMHRLVNRMSDGPAKTKKRA